jgi:hypothetical protein
MKAGAEWLPAEIIYSLAVTAKTQCQVQELVGTLWGLPEAGGVPVCAVVR